jgi:DNA-binding HxlR family transcriptional regulator
VAAEQPKKLPSPVRREAEANDYAKNKKRGIHTDLRQPVNCYNVMSASRSPQPEQVSDETLQEGLCPRFHRAVELVGRRWTGAIIRLLLPGPKRFNELLSAIPGISDRLLTERLRELEATEIIQREVQSGAPIRVLYQLTTRGRELQEALDALARWAERWIESDFSEDR